MHRDFCEVAIADGGRARSARRIAATPDQLELFARSLVRTDRVVLEATGNALAIARILAPHVAEVVLAHAKNEIAAVMHRNLKGRNPASDPFGKKGRQWIATQQLPIDERLTVDGCLRQLDFLGAGLAQLDEVVARAALGDRGRPPADDDPRRRRHLCRHAGRRDR